MKDKIIAKGYLLNMIKEAMKGANSIFATDSASNAIVYTRADILRSEEAEVKHFVD